MKEKAYDSSNKIRLLEKEVAFNESLAATLDLIRSSCRILDSADQAFATGDLRDALHKIKQCDESSAALSAVQDTRAAGLLQTRSTRFKASFLDKATSLAQSLIQCDLVEHAVTIQRQSSGISTENATPVTDTNFMQKCRQSTSSWLLRF